jgi:hypothetical protein
LHGCKLQEKDGAVRRGRFEGKAFKNAHKIVISIPHRQKFSAVFALFGHNFFIFNKITHFAHLLCIV